MGISENLEREIEIFIKSEICEPCKEGELENCNECNYNIILDLIKNSKIASCDRYKLLSTKKYKQALDSIENICQIESENNRYSGACVFKKIIEIIGKAKEWK
uniref:Uncharacterized protein n=1 Tax=Dulem virus 31 TaxID=3145749 RepID=A0AAU8AUT7_9VIRU